MPVCRYCGQDVWGEYVTALGATWHPEHFFCAGCGQPLLEPRFQVFEGKPYHEACYLRFQAPRCAFCGQPIVGMYYKHEGKTYHDECYHEHVLPRCAYCHKPLSGRYLIDSWGNHYCPEHQEQYPRCLCCSRLIPPEQQTAGWQDYGITRCAICRTQAVETAEQAQPLFQECKRWLAQQGFRFNQLPLQLKLRDRATLIALLQGRGLNHPLGVTISSRQVYNGRVKSSHIEGVAVLQGMPSTLFAGVVLHELGHVWLAVHGVEQLPPWAEEGFCELLSYRYYQSLHTSEGEHYAEHLIKSSDPIYGEGLRKMFALAEKKGFQGLVEALQTTRRLPA